MGRPFYFYFPGEGVAELLEIRAQCRVLLYNGTLICLQYKLYIYIYIYIWHSSSTPTGFQIILYHRYDSCSYVSLDYCIIDTTHVVMLG